jgi:hypothetical protein
MTFHAHRYFRFLPLWSERLVLEKISSYSPVANLAAVKGVAPRATPLSCDLEVLQEIREPQVTPFTVQV